MSSANIQYRRQTLFGVLQRSTNFPGEQELQILRIILDRCWLEAREIRSNSINMIDAEPLRHMIEGLSGAGKNELIKWIC